MLMLSLIIGLIIGYFLGLFFMAYGVSLKKVGNLRIIKDKDGDEYMALELSKHQLPADNDFVMLQIKRDIY